MDASVRELFHAALPSLSTYSETVNPKGASPLQSAWTAGLGMPARLARSAITASWRRRSRASNSRPPAGTQSRFGTRTATSPKASVSARNTWKMSPSA